MDMIFNPPANAENQYIQLLVGELRARSYRIHPLGTLFSSRRHFRSIALVHLNWFENIDDTSFFTALRSFLRKLVVLTVIRISGKPLVWTMHNRASHEKGSALFSRAITHLLVHWAHRIVVHTHQSAHLLAAYGTEMPQKALHIPHPHYIGAYGRSGVPAPSEAHRLNLLFMGMVKPYKNLELLIDTVAGYGADVRLTVIGKAVDEGYRQQLTDRATRGGNVTFIPRFIPDGEVAARLAGSDALVLPYDLSSSLNAGTALLAFSYKKTVVCPEIGTVSDLGVHMADTFHYRYDNEQQHRTALNAQIGKALELKRRDPAALRGMGERLHAYVAKAHDPHRAGEALDGLYRELTGRGA